MKFVKLIAAATLTCALAGAAMAQQYPSKNVRLIVPFPPGGATDITARLVATHMSQQWGQTIVVENRAGASGVIGSEAVARSPADGYTLLIGTLAAQVMSHLLRDKVPYPRDAFEPITLLGSTPNMLIASKALPVKTLKELIAYAKANPGKARYASPGVGLSGHLGVELFKQEAKIDLLHVPYRGSAPSVQAFSAGEVELTLALVPEATIAIKKDPGITPLAIAADKRSSQYPNTPTFGELGFPNVQVYALSGLMAPKGTPPDVIAKINAAAVAALKDPALSSKLSQLGIDPRPTTPAEFGKHLDDEFNRWGPLIKANNIKSN